MKRRRYTFHRNIKARTVRGDIVTIPDQVANDQALFDMERLRFPVIRGDGARRKAELRGDLYDLYGSGTGDIIVARV